MEVGRLVQHCAPLLLIALLHWLPVFGLRPIAAAEELTGEQIYQQRCAACHGAQGEGTEDQFPSPLVGDRPLKELTQFIDETMPADDPEACVGEEAERVAAYIFDAFYSESAQARLQRPRIELSRLTVRQYQQTVADLIGSFRQQGEWDDERGLRGEYFDSKRFRDDKRRLERRDAAVSFSFGTSSPVPEKIEAEEFSVRWDGAVLAPDTGTYEFVVKTENAARLWLNDLDRPLIDAGVKSGNETEYRGSVQLLGGRPYPLRLEYFKAKEDSANTEGVASIELRWKPPHGAEELIAERYLSPHEVPELLVLDTPFPPDDRSAGYERGTSVSQAWHEATTYAAIEVAAYVIDHLEELAGVEDGAPDRSEKLRQFCRRFADRAFRRPLTEEEAALFVDRQFQQVENPTQAVKRVVLLVLTSPRFLYRELSPPQLDGYDIAARLSFGLWDSLPDEELLEAAAAGKLQSPDQVAQQAERMLPDLRTKAKLREFLHQWLRLEHMHNIAKDEEKFPGFDEAVVSDLRQSLDLFLEDVIWSDSSDFRQLLLADHLYLNGRLAEFYGSELSSGEAFQKVPTDPSQRAGILSHPLLMSGFAYHSTSSPIHRGVFIARSVLGRVLRPPPEAFTPLSPDLHADLTTRDRVQLQTSPESCQSCHAMINPLGFSLENYDAVGRYRREEAGKAIDASGSYTTLAGEEVEFNGVRQLADFLANNQETHTAFVKQLFHHLVKQPIGAFGPNQPDQLRESFANNNYSVQQLMVDVITTAATYPTNSSTTSE